MNRLQWNALRVGDHVLVHDDAEPDMPLIPGRITAVEPESGSNNITIRVASRGQQARFVRPRRLTVHLDTGETTERCWRCEARYAAAQSTR